MPNVVTRNIRNHCTVVAFRFRMITRHETPSYAAPMCEGAEQPRIGQYNNPGEGVVALYDGAGPHGGLERKEVLRGIEGRPEAPLWDVGGKEINWWRCAG